MPLYDYDCPKGHRFEAYFTKFRNSTPCRAEGCSESARFVLVSLSGVGEGRFIGSAPVVIHKADDGSVRFPGHANAPVPEGFERVELRTTEEKRRFEREINKNEYKRHQEAQERKEQYFGAIRSKNRAELREAMKHMSPRGRDIAMAAMEARDKRVSQKYEAGFHIEALSMDASNRSHCDDPDGRGRK